MPSLPAIDTKRKALIVFAIVSLTLFLLGILFGYMAKPKAKRCSFYTVVGTYCAKSPYTLKKTWRNYFWRSVRAYWGETCYPRYADCNRYLSPRSYVARHLNGKTITIDGKGDDPAWAEVAWSQKFQDMRSKYYPKPYLDTKFKVRWDDNQMYVLVYVQDTNLYGNLTTNNSNIWKDNGVEIMLDMDGSMHNFKQIQVNAIGLFADLAYEYSPYDGAGWNGGGYTRNWAAELQHQVFTQGTVNTPGDKDKFWTAEIAMNFSALAFNTSRMKDMPDDDEVWFMNLGRGQWKLNVTSDNTYVQVKGNGEWMPEDYWSWQPCGAVNLILPSRWGLVQFQRTGSKKFKFNEWHIYRALFDMFEAMKKYYAINGKYTPDITDLDVPNYLFSRVCVEVPNITLLASPSTGDFDVTVVSRLLKTVPTAHIRGDRYVWFK